MTILAIYSNKGGVGKTATAVNLSYLAAQDGIRTLICDLDPQSSATYYFRVKPKLKRGAKGFMTAGKDIDRSIKGTDYENLDILPADFSHRNMDIIFNDMKRSKLRLSKVLKPLEKEYDLIILDCLSVINIVAENIFNATDSMLVPIIPTTLSVRTYGQLLSFLKSIDYDRKKVYTYFSMVDRRKKMHHSLMAYVSKKVKRVLKSSIPNLAVIEKMGVERQPVPAFARSSYATWAYKELWAEVREKVLNGL